jgi:hypothetical protein
VHALQDSIGDHLAELIPRCIEVRLRIADTWLGNCSPRHSLDRPIDLGGVRDVADGISCFQHPLAQLTLLDVQVSDQGGKLLGEVVPFRQAVVRVVPMLAGFAAAVRGEARH